MARLTDTRARVREIAEQLSQDGLKPTPGLIRKLLGRGSPNTIVEELKAWQSERAVHSSSSGLKLPPEALERVGLREISELLERLLLVQSQMQRPSLSETSPSIANLTQKLTELAVSLEKLECKLENDRQMVQREFKNASGRFDGVQRYMLLQVEEARQEATRWKLKHDSIQRELGTWRGTMQIKNQALLEELIWLKGKYGVVLAREKTSSTDFSAEIEEPRDLGRYPGHPRARPESDAEEGVAPDFSAEIHRNGRFQR